MLKGIHNFLHKNSIAALGPKKMKGISNPDFNKVIQGNQFSGSVDQAESVDEMMNQMTSMDFERPDMRKYRRNVGKDEDLFGMIT